MGLKGVGVGNVMGSIRTGLGGAEPTHDKRGTIKPPKIRRGGPQKVRGIKKKKMITG